MFSRALPVLRRLILYLAYRGKLRAIWIYDILRAVILIVSTRLWRRSAPLRSAARFREPWIFFGAGFALGMIVMGLTAASPPLVPSVRPVGTVEAGTGSRQNSIGLLGLPSTAEVDRALAAMEPRELSLAFARIHYAFETALGDGQFDNAAALLGFAERAQRELNRRGIRHPETAATAAEMRMLLEIMQ